jgi:tetratricopeptide (TPR) repeat protein
MDEPETDREQAFLESLVQTAEYNLSWLKWQLDDYRSKANPSGVDKLRARAVMLYFGNYYPQARDAFNALVAVDPSDYNLVKLAQINLYLGAYHAALKAAERAVVVNPSSEMTHQVMAAAHLGLGDMTAALAAAEAAMKLGCDPRNAAFAQLARAALGEPAASVEEESAAGSSLSALIDDFRQPLAAAGLLENRSLHNVVTVVARAEKLTFPA